MKKRAILAIFALLIANSLVFAQTSELASDEEASVENETPMETPQQVAKTKRAEAFKAEDPSGFTSSVDTSKKKPGKYNYYLEARDKANNITLSGPENIFIDPESDLPRATIINPMPNMHIQGNLNIVGIAVDDDGVKKVEITITRGRDGKGEELVRTTAEGTDFWSYFLDTTDTEIWTDGVYTITAWATDINDLSGIADKYLNGAKVPVKAYKTHSVYWNLDRKKPDTKITSHEIGALVSGKIRIKGTVADGNGIQYFSYSTDGGNKYIPAKTTYDKKKNIYNWDISLSTKDILKDGPQVIWFKGRDFMRTEGLAAHLFFVNNTPPDVGIVYPMPPQESDPAEDGETAGQTLSFAPPQLGRPNTLQQMLNKLPAVPLAGKNLKIEFGGDTWIATANKKNFMAGKIETDDGVGNVTMITLKITHLVPPVKIPGVSWIPVPGPEIVLEYNEGESLKLVSADISLDSLTKGMSFKKKKQEVKEVTVNGLFTIAGYASHPVGIKSLKWKSGKNGGSIPIVIGNNWWSQVIDIRGQKLSSMEIEIHAEDVSGNITIKKQKFKVDQNADLPVVALTHPAPGTITGDLVVKGTASDDDGVASVFYSVNGEAAVEIPCNGYFQFLIPASSIPPGNNTISFWAKDITGLVNPNKVEVKGIVVPGPLPEPRIAVVTTGSGKTASAKKFFTGMVINHDPKIVMEVTVKSPNALLSSNITFGEHGSSLPLKLSSGKDGLFRGTVQVPQGLSGLVRIEIKTTDRSGRLAVYEEYAYFGRSQDQSGQAFTWARARTLNNGSIVISSNEEPLIGLGSVRISSATIQGSGAETFNVSVDEGRVLLNAVREGSYGPLTLRIQDENYSSYDSQQFNFVVDFSPGPAVNLADIPEIQWIQNTVPLRFSVTSTTSNVSAVEYSLDMGDTWIAIASFTDMARLVAPVNTSFERTLDVSSAQDGSLVILVRAVSEAGAEGISSFRILKDATAPAVKLVMPIAGAKVNGTIRMGFDIKENGVIKSISYKRPASGADREISHQLYPKPLDASYDEDGNQVQSKETEYPPLFLEVPIDAVEMPLAKNMIFTFEDSAGNKTEINSYNFEIDNIIDLPIVEISLPLDNEVISSDFIISGVCYDDDEVEKIYYKLDNGGENILESKYGFSIPVPISTMTDNEHSVTIYAEDIYGVKGEPVTRNFRISLAEPAGAVTYPTFETVLREIVEVKGTASDKNSIDGIQTSLNNGISYNSAFGAEAWNYSFNTKILKDGPHVMFYRVWDKYGISAMYSTLINIDNTPPEIILDSPADGMIVTGRVVIMGRALDPNLEDVTIELRSLEGKTIPADIKTRKLGDAASFKEEFNLAPLADGLYNIEIVALDKAGNITRISRNINLARQSLKNFVEVLYPLENEEVQGNFNIYGISGGNDNAKSVTLRINGVDKQIAEVPESGYFRFSLTPEDIGDGENVLVVHSNFGGGALVESAARVVSYKSEGPWVTIDSFSIGDFAFNRPYFYGRAGYNFKFEDEEVPTEISAEEFAGEASEADAEIYGENETEIPAKEKKKAPAKKRKLTKEEKEAIREKAHDFTEISFDNGKTFILTGTSMKKEIDWRYRLETGDMAEGMHYILVRSTMLNGEVAVTRIVVQVDKTSPEIRLISPEAGGRYNTEIVYSASASDDVELVSLEYHLRKGDKAFYEVPGFIQGLYFEGIIPPLVKQSINEAPNVFSGGATYTDFGMGLSFFDDNVKIQVSYGFMFQDTYESMGGDQPVRYGGHVLGIKLLANIYRLPFGSFLGPDWEWLSATFAVGANFSLFDLAEEGYTQSGSSTWMSALLFQIEFPRVTGTWKYFRTFSLFTEGSLWFVPTDVDAKQNDIPVIMPKIILGIRSYVF